MRPRAPLHCVQATAAASTARFRLWTEPPESDYQGALDFRARAAGRVRGHAAPERARAADGLAARRDVPARAGRGRARLDAPAQLALAPGSWDPFGVQRVRDLTSRPRAARLHFELFDLGRPLAARIPERFESVDLDAVRGALRPGA
jgi:hypothetical protein